MNCARAMGASWIFLTLGAGCGAEESQFIVNYAPDFASANPHTVSIFGVFKDGRMDAEAWDVVAPRLSNLFARSACTAAFGADLVSNSAPLASAVDEYTRNYGVTDPLLDEFGAAAKGDLILVLSIAGKPRSAGADGEPASEPPPQTIRGAGGARPGGARRGGSPPPGDPHHNAGTSHPVEVSASLFSVPLRRSVASVVERYAGKSADEAIANLEQKLREGIPGAGCAGWDFDTHPVDASRVHELPEP